jgi:hypothetical protein
MTGMIFPIIRSMTSFLIVYILYVLLFSFVVDKADDIDGMGSEKIISKI